MRIAKDGRYIGFPHKVNALRYDFGAEYQRVLMPRRRFQLCGVQDAAVGKIPFACRQRPFLSGDPNANGSFRDHNDFKFIVPVIGNSNFCQVVVEESDGKILCAIGKKLPAVFIHSVHR